MENFLSFELKRGDVILSYSKERFWGPISRIIWWASRTSKKDLKISHSTLYIGNNLVCDILPQGVVILNLEYYNKKNFTVYIARPTEPINTDALVEKAFKDAGMVRYDYVQLLRILFHKFRIKIPCLNKNNKKRQICSEWIVDALRYAGTNVIEGDSSLVSPIDISKSNKIKIVYKGNNKWKV